MSSAGSTKVWDTYTLAELILPPEGGGLRRYVMVSWGRELDYQEPTRIWHTYSHVSKMIRSYNSLVKQEIIEYNENDILAILFHDIIYIPQNKNNEYMSAKLAIENLSSYNSDINFIEKTILATKSHVKTGDFRIDTILDLDIEVLGASFDIYNLYRGGIRLEYSMFSDEDFNKGRKDFLNNMLKKDSIFLTDYFKSNFEKRAIDNITREIIKY